MQAEIAEVVAVPEVRKYFAENSLVPLGGSPEEIADCLRKDIARQADIVKKIGLEPQ